MGKPNQDSRYLNSLTLLLFGAGLFLYGVGSLIFGGREFTISFMASVITLFFGLGLGVVLAPLVNRGKD